MVSRVTLPGGRVSSVTESRLTRAWKWATGSTSPWSQWLERSLRRSVALTYIAMPSLAVGLHLAGGRVTADAAVGLVGIGVAAVPVLMFAGRLETFGGLLGIVSAAIGLAILGQPEDGVDVEREPGTVIWVSVFGVLALVFIVAARREEFAKDMAHLPGDVAYAVKALGLLAPWLAAGSCLLLLFAGDSKLT